MATEYHAEHVGSLLRPQSIIEARISGSAPVAADGRLRELEDEAILDALDLQREAGIEIFTDGELRRDSWMAALMEEMGGLVPGESALSTASWHRDNQDDLDDQETQFSVAVVAEKVYRKLNLTNTEAEFMAKHAPGQYKITMMSAAMGPMLWDPRVSQKAYPTPGQLVEDLAQLQVEEIEGLIDQGVNWIQIDSLSYAAAIDDSLREGLAAGPGAEALVRMSVDVDNQLIRAAKAKDPDVTVAMHFCRGNNRSSWVAQGSYDWIAEKVFGETDFDRYLLEYDTERAGGFEPLRYFPKGKTVVLGIVSSKIPELESEDELVRRIEEASRYVAIEDLAISPQCGFASTLRGNLLTVDDEKRKLELVVRTAERVWG